MLLRLRRPSAAATVPDSQTSRVAGGRWRPGRRRPAGPSSSTRTPRPSWRPPPSARQPRARRSTPPGPAGPAPQRRARLADAGSPRRASAAGTHGKTTTTAMIPTCVRLRRGPVLRDRRVADGTTTRRPPRGRASVMGSVEADEKRRLLFLQYPAEVAVVTGNVDPDHLKNWGRPRPLRRRLPPLRHRDQRPTGRGERDDPGAGLTHRLRAGPPSTPHRPSEASGATSARPRRRRADRPAPAPSPAPAPVRLQHAATGRAVRSDARVPGHYNVLNAAAAYAVGPPGSAHRDQVRRRS